MHYGGDTAGPLYPKFYTLTYYSTLESANTRFRKTAPSIPWNQIQEQRSGEEYGMTCCSFFFCAIYRGHYRVNAVIVFEVKLASGLPLYIFGREDCHHDSRSSAQRCIFPVHRKGNWQNAPLCSGVPKLLLPCSVSQNPGSGLAILTFCGRPEHCLTLMLIQCCKQLIFFQGGCGLCYIIRSPHIQQIGLIY